MSPAIYFVTGETLIVDGRVSRYGDNQALKSTDFENRAERGPGL